jgi:hypothetical protein
LRPVYDGDGNRVSETVAGVTTKFLVDTLKLTGYSQVLDELVSSSAARGRRPSMDMTVTVTSASQPALRAR